MQIDDRELRTALQYAAASCKTEFGNDLFNRFEYKDQLFKGNYFGCVSQGIALLDKCRSLDLRSYHIVHKGTAFYWIGTAAFLLNDFETATFFFDAAVSEDLRAGCHPVTRSTPSFKFLLIQGDQPAQAAQRLVQSTQDRVESILRDYSARDGAVSLPPPDIDRLRRDFLVPALSPEHRNWRSLATAFVSFVLEWNYLNTFLDLRTSWGTAEPFFIHLFKGCVLFESLLRLNPLVKSTETSPSLVHVLQKVRTQLGIPNNIQIRSSGLQPLLHELPSTGSIQDCIRFTGKLRNTMGHNIGWDASLDKISYHKLFRMVAISCIHAILTLYQP
jgi:hypothetical protein